MKEIMEENKDHIEAKYPKNSFMYLFWKQKQEEALGKKDLRGMRWHPLMIRWCLYLRHLSNKAYKMLRDLLAIPENTEGLHILHQVRYRILK